MIDFKRYSQPVNPRMTTQHRFSLPKSIGVIITALICLLVATPEVRSDENPPGKMTYQGFLTDGDGKPLGIGNPTNVAVIFRIWDTSQGGTLGAGNLKWASQQTVTVDNGHFSVLLGEGSQVGSEPSPELATVFTGQTASDRYMEITVEGVAITPRLRFLPSPYAMLAKSANQLVGTDGNPIVDSQSLRVAGNAEAGSLNVTGVATTGTLSVNGAVTAASLTVAGTAAAASLTVAGTAAAGMFTGDGSGLTDLNADRITTGTFTGNGSGLTQLGGDGSRFTGLKAANLTGVIGDGSLSGNVAKKNSVNAFSQENSFSQEVNFYKRPGTGNNPTGASLTVGNLAGFSTASDSAYNGIIEFSGIGWQSGKIAYLPHTVNGFSKFVVSASNNGGLSGKRVDLLVGGAGTFQGVVTASGFIDASDERIKNIVGPTDSARDLATLRDIKITDYGYKDAKRYGLGKHKKVLAQQVEELFPQAVSRSTGVVPDIMQSSELRSGWVTLATDLKVGERVRLIAGETDGIFEVLEVTPERFRSELSMKDGAVMVYGREVKDFRSVDYDAIAMLNVSATQELARRLDAVEARESRLHELEQKASQISALETEVRQLKAKVASMDALGRELALLKKLVSQVQEQREDASRSRLATISNRTATSAR